MSTIAHNDWLQPYGVPHVRPRTTNASMLRMSTPNNDYGSATSIARSPDLTASHLQIDRIAALSKDWDGYGSEKPDARSVERARQLLEVAYGLATFGWVHPDISASEDGEVVFEWWNGIRKLTIFVGPIYSTFLKSWGPHVVNEMEDGVLPQLWDQTLWLWLFG